MAKMMGPRFKQCRRLGLNVCGKSNAMNRAGRDTARDSGKLSEYGKQLLEKQRLRAYYGVLEKQFSNLFKEAKRTGEKPGPTLVKFLERRLDNMVFRMGFASSIRQARQFVSHGHIAVNGKKLDRPSYRLKVNDVLTLTDKGNDVALIKENFEVNFATSYPYISKEENCKASLIAIPERQDIPVQIDDQLIVEFYSKNL